MTLVFANKPKRISMGQSEMDNPEKLEHRDVNEFPVFGKTQAPALITRDHCMSWDRANQTLGRLLQGDIFNGRKSTLSIISCSLSSFDLYVGLCLFCKILSGHEYCRNCICLTINNNPSISKENTLWWDDLLILANLTRKQNITYYCINIMTDI